MENTRSSTGSRVVWLIGLVALAFGVGAGWQYLQVRQARAAAASLRAELAQAQSDLGVTRATARLGVALTLARDGRYEDARRAASAFFVGLQEHVGSHPSTPGELSAALARRDEVIASLSRSEPRAADELVSILSTFASVMGDRNIAVPLSGGIGEAPASSATVQPRGDSVSRAPSEPRRPTPRARRDTLSLSDTLSLADTQSRRDARK